MTDNNWQLKRDEVCWICESRTTNLPVDSPTAFNLGAGPRYICKSCSEKMTPEATVDLIQQVMEAV